MSGWIGSVVRVEPVDGMLMVGVVGQWVVRLLVDSESVNPR